MLSEILEEAQGIKPMAQSWERPDPRAGPQRWDPRWEPRTTLSCSVPTWLPSCPRSYVGQRPLSLYPSVLREGRSIEV